jgi:hypothetical protein
LDTLSIFWTNLPGDTSYTGTFLDYNFLYILIPVPKDFSASAVLAWNGALFATNSGTGVTIKLNNDYPPDSASNDPAGIYFIQMVPVGRDTSGQYYFSGIFEGRIGNSISITKARFDFRIDPSQIQF